VTARSLSGFAVAAMAAGSGEENRESREDEGMRRGGS